MPFMEDALHKLDHVGVVPKGDTINFRQSLRYGGTVDADGPPLKTPMEEESQICHSTVHSNGIERKSSGQQELLELDPGTFIWIIGAVSPSCRNETEGAVDHDLEAVETKESSQATRRRPRRSERGKNAPKDWNRMSKTAE